MSQDIVGSDRELTLLLGEKCPECGWRREGHRPAIGDRPECPRVASPEHPTR